MTLLHASFAPLYGKISMSYLVSGAGRGIGLALVQGLLQHESTRFVFAGVRNVSGAQELTKLAEKDARVVVFPLDMDDDQLIRSTVDIIALRTDSLSAVINNAGFAPEKTTPALSVPASTFLQAFRTNTMGPILLVQTLLPLLTKEPRGGLVVNVSSLLGSIQLNPGVQVAYAVSKAALNMATVIFQKQNKNLSFLAVHPGSVATDMRPDLKLPNAMPHITAETSAAGILQNVVFAENVRSLGGKFVTWDGKDMPW